MKKLITEQEIFAFLKTGSLEFIKEKDMVFTPLALDRIKIAGLRLVEPGQRSSAETSLASEKKFFSQIALASDHTGFSMKREITGYLQKEGIIVVDVGCSSEESCDYPDFAIAASRRVQQKESDGAIIFDATGIPSAITANKLKGIRAATVYNEFSVRSSRAHNNSNVIVIGAKTLGIETVKGIIKTWLTTAFEGGRHQKRLDKIHLLEK